ncbi:MAG: DNA polymerase Y family protein [Deltaproteobacteria bacterium]|nr:DNA polymerase Y family protein [Deltaproteobacteria bacterium]
MDRLACVNLPAFALQLARKHRPDWAGFPAAVVSSESQSSEILEVCEQARRLGVMPGLRYAAALALAPGLRACAVTPGEIEEGVHTTTTLLRGLTPDVEPSKDEPGTFWLNAAGFHCLYPSIHKWAESIREALKKQGFASTVAVGFTCFGTYALSRQGQGVIIMDTTEREAALTHLVPLTRMELPHSVRMGLAKLGKRTVGDLLGLPAGHLLERFGPKAHRLHRLATGELNTPLQPVSVKERIIEKIELSGPVVDTAALTFLIKRLLGALLAKIAARHQLVAGLEIHLLLDRGGEVVEIVRPAAPCLDEARLIDLVRLRLDSLAFGDGVAEIQLAAQAVKAIAGQLQLFVKRPRRDLAAGERAFARLRAMYGPNAVVSVKLKEGHLPEARFSFEPLHRFCFPTPSAGGDERPLIRRIYSKPIPLQPRPVCGPRGCHLDGMDTEPISKLQGPHIVSGGWWVRLVEREYHFAETEKGNISWIYFDRQRHRWFIHGKVE